MSVATAGVAIQTDMAVALTEELEINRMCGQDSESEFALNHLPQGQSPEFYRGMASGLLLAAGIVADDNELIGMLRCLAAHCSAEMLN